MAQCSQPQIPTSMSQHVIQFNPRQSSRVGKTTGLDKVTHPTDASGEGNN